MTQARVIFQAGRRNPRARFQIDGEKQTITSIETVNAAAQAHPHFVILSEGNVISDGM